MLPQLTRFDVRRVFRRKTAQPSGYWAFISYSRADAIWARNLHRRLESYRIPGHARPQADGPSPTRIRPVFLDTDELPASSDLGARLRDALTRSRWLIVLATSRSASSTWVRTEIQHFVDAGRAQDVLVVSLDETGRTDILAALPVEPIWIDGHGSARPTRPALLRLIAGMLGVGFDALRRRDRRRRWRLATAWLSVMLMIAGATGVAWRRIVAQERLTTARQTTAFRTFLSADPLESLRATAREPGAPDVGFTVLLADDLNNDSLLDFMVSPHTSKYCDFDGCGLETYLAEPGGTYQKVLTKNFGSSIPHTRQQGSSGFDEILTADYRVDDAAVYSVYQWTGNEYALTHYEFCARAAFDFCADPNVSTYKVDFKVVGSSADESLRVKSSAVFHSLPMALEAPVRIFEGSRLQRIVTVLGISSDRKWYLICPYGGTAAAFVQSEDIV